MYGAIDVIFTKFGQAGVKRYGGHFKVINWGGNAIHKRGPLFIGKGGSHYVMLLYLNFIENLTGYCKRFYRIPVFTILILFDLFCIF